MPSYGFDKGLVRSVQEANVAGGVVGAPQRRATSASATKEQVMARVPRGKGFTLIELLTGG